MTGLDSLGRPNAMTDPAVRRQAKNVSINLRDQLPRLRVMADKKGVTVPELIRSYCEWGLETDGEEDKL